MTTSTQSAAPVLVTGAASGIGAALTRQLSERHVAWIGIDKNPADGVLECDLSDPDSITSLAAQLPDELGGIANVAGVPGTAPARVVLAVNLLGPRLLTEALQHRLGPSTAVVNVASVAAHRNTQPPEAIASLLAVSDLDGLDAWLAAHPLEGPAAYDTSKRALVDWTPLKAAELITSTVRCLSVSPGPVETPILDDFATSMGADSMARSVAAVGRHGRPDEIASVVGFALSREASWLNGIDILVEGGLMAARTAASVQNKE